MTATVREAIAAATARLRAAGVEGAARDARRLLEHVLGAQPDPGAALPPEAARRFAAAVAARVDRRPVSQIVGERAFWGRQFRVTADVLDPRPETETLIAAALAGPAPGRILDLGTGSGAILLTLLAEWPEAEGVGSDLSPAALAVAWQNAGRLGVAERARLISADWWTGVAGCFDLIVSNPPYIPAAEVPTLAPELRRWEPSMALTPGADGLAAYRRIAVGLATHLAPGGRALFEVGAGQGAEVAALFATGGWHTYMHEDMDGRGRVVGVARAPHSGG
ncbi:MAG: peptide chain release factor N(5)-glutamine methyltransferase [Pseudomonadota bacterium]